MTWPTRSSLLLSLAVFATIPAHGFIVGTRLPGSGLSFELSVANYQFVAQGFTLTNPVQLLHIAVDMSGFGVDPFTLWLTNAIGPGATAANVLYETTLTFPNTGGGVTAAEALIAHAPPNLFLPAGSYFIIESSAQLDLRQGWVNGPDPYGNVGTMYTTCCAPGSSTNTAFPPSSTFVPSTGTVAFEISAFEVPEPQTLFSLGLGLATILLAKARMLKRDAGSAR